MTRAALYHRVSTTDQNVTNARKALRQAAKARGYTVALDVEETGSGARNDRPGWQRVMDAVRRHQVEAVIVWKLDRAGRSTIDLLTNIKEIIAAGARLISASDGLEAKPNGDAMSGFMLNVMAAIAEFEREQLRERTRLGLARARAEGKVFGRRRALSDAQALQVAGLRHHGHSWAEVAKAVGCSPSSAARALARLPEKGPRKRGRELDGKR